MYNSFHLCKDTIKLDTHGISLNFFADKFKVFINILINNVLLAGIEPAWTFGPSDFKSGASNLFHHKSIVPLTGLEPARLSALVPKTSVSTNSTTKAFAEDCGPDPQSPK